MDLPRFDSVTQSLSSLGSRRRALALALSGALAPLLTREEIAAHDALNASGYGPPSRRKATKAA